MNAPGPRYRRSLFIADDHGATAVITAVLVSLLFAVAALTVDLGNAYARDARIDAIADQAAVAAARALPDPCAAVAAAAEVFLADGNAIVDDSGEFPLTEEDLRAALSDGDLANGEVQMTGPDGVAVSPTDCTAVGTRARVVTPPVQVSFGLAAAAGFRSVDVRGTATAALVSPLPVLPFAIPEECAAEPARTYVFDPPEASPVVVPVGPTYPFVDVLPVGTLEAVDIGVTSDNVTAVVRGTRASDEDWVVQFTAVVAGEPRQWKTTPPPPPPEGDFPRFFPDSDPDAFTVAVPPEVLAAGGTWTAQIGRSPNNSSEEPLDTDGDGYLWSANSVDVFVSEAATTTVSACDTSGVYGNVLLIPSGSPGTAAAVGLTNPVRDGDTVTVASHDIQRSFASNVSNGVLARLERPGPECPADPLLTQGTWTIAGRAIVATNHAACYGVVPDGTSPDLTWSFSEPAIAEDPRLFLVPVVDLDPALEDPPVPAAETTVTVSGYRVAYLTDESPQTVADGDPVPDCSAAGTTSCTGVTAAGPSGPLTRLSFVTFGPEALDLDGGVRLADNGHPWLTGPLPAEAPRDVHLVE